MFISYELTYLSSTVDEEFANNIGPDPEFAELFPECCGTKIWYKFYEWPCTPQDCYRQSDGRMNGHIISLTIAPFDIRIGPNNKNEKCRQHIDACDARPYMHCLCIQWKIQQLANNKHTATGSQSRRLLLYVCWTTRQMSLLSLTIGTSSYLHNGVHQIDHQNQNGQEAFAGWQTDKMNAYDGRFKAGCTNAT